MVQDFFHQQKEGLRPTRGHSSQTLKQSSGKDFVFFLDIAPVFCEKMVKTDVVFLVKNRCPVKCVDFLQLHHFVTWLRIWELIHGSWNETTSLDDFFGEWTHIFVDVNGEQKHLLPGGFKYFFIFTPIWGRFPFWLIFFKWVETTNQKTSWFKLFPNTNSGFVGFGFSLFPVLVADEGSQESPSCNSPGGHYHGEAKCWW